MGNKKSIFPFISPVFSSFLRPSSAVASLRPLLQAVGPPCFLVSSHQSPTLRWGPHGPLPF